MAGSKQKRLFTLLAEVLNSLSYARTKFNTVQSARRSLYNKIKKLVNEVERRENIIVDVGLVFSEKHLN